MGEVEHLKKKVEQKQIQMEEGEYCLEKEIEVLQVKVQEEEIKVGASIQHRENFKYHQNWHDLQARARNKEETIPKTNGIPKMPEELRKQGFRTGESDYKSLWEPDIEFSADDDTWKWTSKSGAKRERDCKSAKTGQTS